jgi:hypothetical protein
VCVHIGWWMMDADHHQRGFGIFYTDGNAAARSKYTRDSTLPRERGSITMF